MKLEYSGQIFEKFSNIIFHENLSCVSRRAVPWEDELTGGRSDRHDESNSSFSQFFERACKHFANLACRWLRHSGDEVR